MGLEEDVTYDTGKSDKQKSDVRTSLRWYKKSCIVCSNK